MPIFLAHLLVLQLHTYGWCTSRKARINQPKKKNISKATATKQKITQHAKQCAVTGSTKSIPKV
jgi:hypothetical protein